MSGSLQGPRPFPGTKSAAKEIKFSKLTVTPLTETLWEAKPNFAIRRNIGNATLIHLNKAAKYSNPSLRRYPRIKGKFICIPRNKKYCVYNLQKKKNFFFKFIEDIFFGFNVRVNPKLINILIGKSFG